MDLSKIQQVLADTQFQKDITSASIQSAAGNTGLSRQDLESVLRVTSNRGTPLRDLIKREKGNGVAHSWNIRTSVNNLRPMDYIYPDNGLGQQVVPTYTQKSAAYKALGYVEAISNFAIEAGRSFIDLESEIVEAGMKAVTQAEDWLIYHSDSTVTNINSTTGFDGLDKQIQSNVIAINGTISTDALDRAFQRIRASGGGQDPNRYVIMCSFGVQRAINQIQQTGSGNNTHFVIPVQDANNVPIGMNVPFYNSPIGAVRIMGDYFVNAQGPNPYPLPNAAGSGSSSATGLSTSSVYILDLDSMAMVDLLPLVREQLMMYNADNWRIFVKEYTTLAVKVEQFNAILTGITEPSY